LTGLVNIPSFRALLKGPGAVLCLFVVPAALPVDVFFERRSRMKVRLAACLVVAAGVALVHTAVMADTLKSGPDKKSGGAFDVKAITGALKGKTLCYV
jgi:hypothetical protein